MSDPRLTAPNGVSLGNEWKEAARPAIARRPLPFLKPPLATNAATIPRQYRASVRDSLWAAVYVAMVMVTMFIAGYALG